MSTIKIAKSDLTQAIDACDVNGNFYLCLDGRTVWGQHNGGFPLPDDALVKIPVANPDGSGSLYDACWETLEEKFKDEYYDSDFDGTLQAFIGDKIDGESVTVFVEENYPDEFEDVEKFLVNQAIDELKISLEEINFSLEVVE